MKRFLLAIFLLATLSVSADERGEARLNRIATHYSALGNYTVEFVLRVGGGEQRGEMIVAGDNSYMKVGDTEVYVEGNLRYEVRASSKEIIIDKADLYEKELLNLAGGLSTVKRDYNVEECVVGGAAALRLTPKMSGETIYIITGSDGASISKLQYASGDNRAELSVTRCQKRTTSIPTFSKDRYKGFDLIDFR